MTRKSNWNVDIQVSDSPVQHLLPSVIASLERIAPERVQELTQKADGLTIAITDSAAFTCEALPTFSAIKLSRRVVELAWAFSYAYWELYRVVLAGRQPDGTVIDLHSFYELEQSLRLLSWALTELTEGAELAWPSAVPIPTSTRAEGSAEHVADDVALCAVAMFLHHELAHVYAPAGHAMSPMDEERYCDAAAAEWILCSPGLDEAVVQKRAWGVAVGMLMLTARGAGKKSDGVHPAGYDRLIAVLDGRVPSSQEAVWGLVTGMLALHVSRAGLPPNTAEYDGFHEAALGYRDHIRKHDQRRDAPD